MVHQLRAVSYGIAVAVAITTVAEAQVGPATTARTEIQQVVRAYIEAHNNADAATIAEMYSREAGVTSVGDGVITRGWDRIREAFDQLVGAEGKFRVSIGSIDVTPLGPSYSLALTSYTLTTTAAGTETQQRGAMTLVLQKVAGEWKIIHDHTSTLSTPPQAAAVPAPSSLPPTVSPPASSTPSPNVTTVTITDGQAVEIGPGKFIHYAFQLPAGTCTVTGRIVGISGGSKDFDALLLDDDNFRNWSANAQSRVYWQSGRVVVANLNAVVAGPGTFHLVVSNVWSTLTSKTVQPQALARCSR